jgi:hypothetical protein
MNSLDYLLIAFFAIALIVALIRGLKHDATRFEGDAFAFLLAFLGAVYFHGLLFEKSTSYAKAIMDFQSKLPSNFALWGDWIVIAAFFLVIFLLLFFLFRFLYSRLGGRKVPTLFLSLGTYLTLAYVLGLVLCVILEKNTGVLSYSASLLGTKLYPSESFLNVILIGVGA